MVLIGQSRKLIALLRRVRGYVLAVSQQGGDHVRGAALRINAQHRLGAGRAVLGYVMVSF